MGSKANGITEGHPKSEAWMRSSLDCEPFGDEGLVRYPMGIDFIVGRPGKLFEDLARVGPCMKRRIVRVVDGKDVVIWQAEYLT